MIKRRKRNTIRYWTSETDAAIVAFNAETDDTKREEIYNNHIHAPLMKLCENVINTFNFKYFECSRLDSIMDCVIHVYGVLHKFDPLRDSSKHLNKKVSGYSYFTIVARNYYIKVNNENFKRWKETQSMVAETELGQDMLDAKMTQGYTEFLEQTENESLTNLQLEEFYDMFEWAKDAKLGCNDRKFMERCKDLIEGKCEFKRKPSGMALVQNSLMYGISQMAPYRGLITMKTLLRKYRNQMKGKKCPYIHQGNTSSRHCPKCDATITYRGKASSYNCYYAEMRGSVCVECSNKKNLKRKKSIVQPVV